MSLFVLFLYGFGIVLCIERNMESNPVSCIGLDDGLYYIRPNIFIENEINTETLPSILVRCSKEWIIFDYSLDSNIKHYFTSFMPITDDFGSMDVGLQHINWNNWLLLKNIKFTISQDCNICSNDNDNNNDNDNDNDIAYYMTGNYYGCSFATKSLCDMSPNTLQCNKCAGLINDDKEYPGLCTHIILNINNNDINNQFTSHQKCVTSKWNYLPSIGLNGKFCPCLKPIINDSKHLKVKPLYIDKTTTIDNDDDNDDDDDDDDEVINCNDRVIELKNDNFKRGTYRIRKCGIYKLMEDISLNMNAPSIEQDIEDKAFNEYYGSPNDNNYWWPSYDQQQDIDEYPSNNFIGAYAMGFFAGISVETDDVIIDLNGYELKMAHDFYIQQRFFSLIELASKPFLSGQGPVNFGSINVHYPSNIIIKNGILGLTSHHGIHGNNNKNVKIFDIKFIDFEISGISMNGFDGLIIEDVDIGPNYQNIPITSQYAHGRFMLQRLELIPDREDKFVIINKQKVFANDIIDTLREEMDDAFRFSHNIDDIEYDDDIYNNLFVNIDGLPHGGTLYGIFLNSEGASVFGLGLSPGYSSNVVLRNINIHELRSNPMETVRAQLQRGPFNDLLDMKRIINTENNKYVDTSYSNAQYALNRLISDTEWSILGHTFINKQIINWISGNKKLHTKFKCNSDIMLHLTKGIFAIRIDNVYNIDIDGYLNIQNIHNLGEFGESKLCNKYFSGKNGGHHNQQYPQQIGYTGNEVHGISFIGSNGNIMKNANIYINDLISARGSSFGINFYSNNNIKIHENVMMSINNIHSGAYLNDDTVDILSNDLLPNTVPRTCVIDIWMDNNIEFDENAKISSQCITGYDSCSFRYSQIDNKYTKENDILNKDYMLNMINNDDCQYNKDDNNENILVSLSRLSSKYHLKTLNLLALQSKPEEIKKIIKNDNHHIYYYYFLMSMLSINIMMIILCWLFCSRNTTKTLENGEYSLLSSH